MESPSRIGCLVAADFVAPGTTMEFSSYFSTSSLAEEIVDLANTGPCGGERVLLDALESLLLAP